jgi:hypothetical protein
MGVPVNVLLNQAIDSGKTWENIGKYEGMLWDIVGYATDVGYIYICIIYIIIYMYYIYINKLIWGLM